jgi:glycerophosphoryl diester phosphodiesterase
MISALFAVSTAMATPATEYASFHSPPVVIAHRGASQLAPENTLAAIRAAQSVGATAIEFDVHKTEDGHIVLLHDFSLSRTTSGRGRVADKQWSDIKNLDAGSWFSPRFSGERIPLLSQALDVIETDTIVAVEVKSNGNVMADLHRTLESKGLVDRAVIFSFKAKQIRAAKRICPTVPALLLVEPSSGSEEYDSKIIARAIEAGADLIGLNHTAVTAKIVRDAHQRGLPVFVYTVDATDDIHKMLTAGVDGIISNRPRATMNRIEQWSKASQEQGNHNPKQAR